MKTSFKPNLSDQKKFKMKMNRLRKFGIVDFDKTAQDVAAVAVRYAQGRVPVKTGDLKRSIVAERDKKGIYVEAGMSYAGFVEFGTSKQSPQPYFFNSMRDAAGDIEKKMNNKFQTIKRT